jgi:hypothetical protein
MKKNIIGFIVLCLLVFVSVPWIPTPVVNFLVGNYVTVFLLLAANLYLLRIDAALSIAFFLAAGSLFLENRKRTLAKIETSQTNASTNESKQADVASLSVPAENLIDGEVHPEHETPSTEDHPFEPTSEGQSNSFHKVGQSIDEKHVIAGEETHSASEMAERFVKSGYVV